jgi:hypothetical protein
MSSENVNRGLAGLRLLSLESRRADQMARFIENHGGVGLVTPSMREIPLRENSATLSFAEDLFAGKFDAVIFLTGVGARIPFGAVGKKHPRAGGSVVSPVRGCAAPTRWRRWCWSFLDRNSS